MKTKKLITTLIATLYFGLLSGAQAQGVPEIPNGYYNYAYQGPTALQKYEDDNVLSGIYYGYLVSQGGSHLRVGVMNNGKHVGDIVVSPGRSYTYQIDGDLLEDGIVELYFYDGEQRYDSNYGRNFKFMLIRN